MVEKALPLFRSELKVINVGLEIFKETMEAQAVKCIHVVWKEMPKLEKEYEDILSKMM